MFEDFKFEHPRIFYGLIGGFVGAFLVGLFFSLPTTPFLTSIGINGVQKRGSALGSAGYWKARALLHANSDETQPRKTIWANLAGLDKDGRLLVSVPDGPNWKIEAVGAADARITDLYGAVGLVSQFKSEDARLDYYTDDQVVVWIRNVPFNVKLIEAGFAVPDPNPPTNIVDIAFATYYWYIFKGEKSNETTTQGR